MKNDEAIKIKTNIFRIHLVFDTLYAFLLKCSGYSNKIWCIKRQIMQSSIRK